MKKMKKKIAAGAFLVLALALGFEAIDGPSVSAKGYSPNETENEDITWIKDQIEKWREDPGMQIAATAIHRAEKTVVLWVYERTPENQQLHHKMINGWEIIVAEDVKPPSIWGENMVVIGIAALGIGVAAVILIYKKFQKSNRESRKEK